jgi:hypothetical protein
MQDFLDFAQRLLETVQSAWAENCEAEGGIVGDDECDRQLLLFALMRRAGHKNVATTQRYVDLAGVVFRDEADALEDRMLGAGRKFYPSEPTSPDLASPETAEVSGFSPHLT